MTQEQLTLGLGLFRDIFAAGLALAILFNVDITEDQVAGVLLLITTIGAFASWIFLLKKQSSTPDA